MIPVTIVIFIVVTIYVILCHPSFGCGPHGKYLDRLCASPNFRKGKFHNELTNPALAKNKKLRIILEFLSRPKNNRHPSAPVPTVKPNLHALPQYEDVYVWFGHSSYFLQIDGKRFLVDPVLTNKFPTSLLLRPFKGTDSFTPNDIPNVDYLIITHDHWAPPAYPPIRPFPSRINLFICGLGIGAHLEYWGIPREAIIEMDWHESRTLAGGFTIHCLPSRHFSGRRFIPNETMWASYFLQTPTSRIYMSGDGGYDSRFKSISKQFGRIDLAILENGQYNSNWAQYHLMPHELKQAIDDLHPHKVTTVHHSKYALSNHPWHEPLENAFQLSQTCPMFIPVPGERVHFKKPVPAPSRWWDLN